MLPPELSIISLSIPSIVAQPGAVEVDAVADWTNNLGYIIGVTQIVVWIGESGGSITDTPFSVRNLNQPKPWLPLGEDHYGIPASINANTLMLSLAQGALYVRPNETVEFRVGLVDYNTTQAYAGAGATLYYLS